MKPYKLKVEHAESRAIFTLGTQHNKFLNGSGRIAHICELFSGLSQTKGLADHDNTDKKCLKGPLWAPSSCVSSAPCRHDRVAVVLCAASRHQKRPWLELTEGPGEKEEKRGAGEQEEVVENDRRKHNRSLPPLRWLPFLLH